MVLWITFYCFMISWTTLLPQLLLEGGDGLIIRSKAQKQIRKLLQNCSKNYKLFQKSLKDISRSLLPFVLPKTLHTLCVLCTQTTMAMICSLSSKRYSKSLQEVSYPRKASTSFSSPPRFPNQLFLHWLVPNFSGVNNSHSSKFLLLQSLHAAPNKSN